MHSYRKSRLAMWISLAVCLLSFPFAMFADPPPDDVSSFVYVNEDWTEYTLSGAASNAGVTGYGFQVGETTDYGYTYPSSSVRDPYFEYAGDIGSEQTGELDFDFLNSAVVADDGTIYAVGSTGTPSDGQIIVTNNDGDILDTFGPSSDDPDARYVASAIGPNGNIYVTDFGGSSATVFIYEPNGTLVGTVGAYGSGVGESVYPGDIAVDDEGNVYISDMSLSKIIVFDSSGSLVREITSAASEPFGTVRGIAVGNNELYAVDDTRGKVFVFDLEGNYLRMFGEDTWGDLFGFTGIMDVAVDTDGNVLTSGSYFGVEKYTPTGEFIHRFTEEVYPDNHLESPNYIVVGPSGDVYVTNGFEASEAITTGSVISLTAQHVRNSPIPWAETILTAALLTIFVHTHRTQMEYHTEMTWMDISITTAPL